MSLNIYGNIGTTYTGIVTGAELKSVSEEIFGGAQVKAPEQTSQVTPKINVQPQTENTNQVNLYSRNTDIQLTQQVAQAKTDFNVQLSPQALQNIEALRTLATTQYTKTDKLSEGKVYIPVDNSEKSDMENIFALPHATSVLNAFSMESDRKGSAPFAYTNSSAGNGQESADNGNNSATGMA